MLSNCLCFNFLTILQILLWFTNFVSCNPISSDFSTILNEVTDSQLLDNVMKIDDMHFIIQPIDGLEHRSGLISLNSRWSNRTLIYNIDSKFSNANKMVIRRAINEVETKTCLLFKERSKESTYINIVKGKSNSGCWSYIGKVPKNYQPQQLNLENGCVHHGIIIHELIHAIGFDHEHNRPDRDSFVQINYSNIQSGLEWNFYKRRDEEVSTFNVPYDYNSIMHYDEFDFSVNGKPTIVPTKSGKPQKVQIGQRHGLSNYDALKINRMYNCE